MSKRSRNAVTTGETVAAINDLSLRESTSSPATLSQIVDSSSGSTLLYSKLRCPTYSPAPNNLRITSKEQRRRARYCLAEQSLAQSFRKHCASPSAVDVLSPQERQIRALHQASNLLKHHADDARENLQKLRAQLAEKGCDAAIYESAQRERWMEEKKSMEFTKEMELVETMIHSLQKNGLSTASSSVLKDVTQPTNEDLRKQANLSKFLSSTNTKKRVSLSSTASITIPTHRSMDFSSLRRTLQDVSPLQLRAHIQTGRKDFTRSHNRSMSLDEPQKKSLALHYLPAAPLPHILPSKRQGHTKSPVLTVVREDDQSPSTPKYPPILMEPSSASSAASSHSAPSTPPPDPSSLPTTHLSVEFPDVLESRSRSSPSCIIPGNEGIAIIYSNPALQRSRAEILSDLNQVDYGKEFESTLPDAFLSSPDLTLQVFNDSKLSPPPVPRKNRTPLSSSTTKNIPASPALSHRSSIRFLRRKPSQLGQPSYSCVSHTLSMSTIRPEDQTKIPSVTLPSTERCSSPSLHSSTPSGKKGLVGKLRNRFSVVGGRR